MLCKSFKFSQLFYVKAYSMTIAKTCLIIVVEEFMFTYITHIRSYNIQKNQVYSLIIRE